MAKLPLIGNCQNDQNDAMNSNHLYWHQQDDNHHALALNAQKWWLPIDYQFMTLAIQQAELAANHAEVPVGAVLVCQGKVLASGHNCPIGCADPTAHAEIVALRQACRFINNYRLPPGTTLYVTLEPCTMCVGALIHARLSRLVFATFEPRSGMLGSQLNLARLTCYNHRISVQNGLMQSQSRDLLKHFFHKRR